MLTITIAVRGSDGWIFHEDKTARSTLKKLAIGSEKKWRYIVRQLQKHKRACKVRFIVGCDDNGKFQYEEMTYRPVQAIETENS